MKNACGASAFVLLLMFTLLSCQTGKKGIFGKSQSAREAYAERLEKAGLLQSALARQWTGAGERSLMQPARITLPHKEAGYFSADEPEATGFLCNLRRGATLNIAVQITPAHSAKVFVELWKIDTATNERNRLAEADSTFSINHEVEKDGLYLIRLQPELLASLEYTLTVTTQPSLAFPVSESGRPAIISVWYDKRDAGSRNHQGVDIGARFRTPALAAANGHVRSVAINKLGGKVVFMRVEGKDYTLYYAHLDSQMVEPGENLLKGDTIGLIGNTGNAINTPPHLHFGVYARGAIDPLPFIDNRPTELKEISASRSHLSKILRSNKKAKIYRLPDAKADTISTIPQGAAFKILSVTKDWYRITLPGTTGYIQSNLVTDNSLREITTDTIMRLLDEPSIGAAAMAGIPSGTNLRIYGTADDFYFVKHDNLEGWVERKRYNN